MAGRTGGPVRPGAGRAPANPYAGTYSPASVRMNKAEFLKAIGGLKVNHPNRYMSEMGYKRGLKKVEGK